MTTLAMGDATAVAYALHDAGFNPGYSSDICDSITAGYGVCDDYGNWEYPLVLDSVDHIHIVPWEVAKYIFGPKDLNGGSIYAHG